MTQDELLAAVFVYAVVMHVVSFAINNQTQRITREALFRFASVR